MSVQSPKPRRPQPLDSAASSAPSSRPPSTSEGKPNRKRRRAEKKKSKDTDKDEPEAKSSVSADLKPANADNGPSTRPTESTFGEEDFIAFTFDDEEKMEEEEVVEVAPPVREWDKGKGKARELDSRKRKLDEVDVNDGYANKKQRLDAASRRAPWAVDVDWDKCNNVAEMLHEEVDAFVKYISPSPVEDEIRSLIVTAISRAVEAAFPGARVHPFGSYETKLYLPLGDIDLVIESYSLSMTESNKMRILQTLAATVKRAGIADKVTIIAKAKVPIVKFVTRHGRFSVDISINQINGIKAGKMVNRFLDELPALRGLVLITKSFLSQRSMNEVYTGGLGSFSIVCLAVSFLQMHPKIRRGEIDPSKNLGVLVMEFFELYGCYFNYNEVGISVRDGGSYYNKAQRGWSDYRSPGLLSIEDPGDPSNDISKGSYGIARVRMTLAGAHSIMTASAFMHANFIASRKSGRRVDFHTRKNPEDMSILASVMGVTQETINHRLLVQGLYDNRVLHKMLGIEPRQTVKRAEANGAASTHAAQESVETAREEEDSDHAPPKGREAEAEEDDESRYGIDRRQPPKKRRKTGTEMDLHTVYTTDEDEEDEDGDGDSDEDEDEDEDEEDEDESVGDLVVHTIENDEEDKQLKKEEAEYDTGGTKAERTRSYWLSKGIPM